MASDQYTLVHDDGGTVHRQSGAFDIILDIDATGRPFIYVPGKIKLTLSRERFGSFAARVKAVHKAIKETDA